MPSVKNLIVSKDRDSNSKKKRAKKKESYPASWGSDEESYWAQNQPK